VTSNRKHACPLCLGAINKQQFIEIALRLGVDVKHLNSTYKSGYIYKPDAIKAVAKRLPVAHVLAKH
jgi:hypothetical protein